MRFSSPTDCPWNLDSQRTIFSIKRVETVHLQERFLLSNSLTSDVEIGSRILFKKKCLSIPSTVYMVMSEELCPFLRQICCHEKQ